MLDIKITRTTAPKAKPDESNLGFGKKFTDHMFVMDYTAKAGTMPALSPTAPLNWTRLLSCSTTLRRSLRA